MVRMTVHYQGDLRCELVHEPSGATIQTDAPKDNMGKGEAFSPTDLIGVSLASCALTTMAIYAKRNGKELGRMSAEVTKIMSADAPRRISKLLLAIRMPGGLVESERLVYQEAAENCPVFKSLHPSIQIETTFSYPDDSSK